MTLLKKLYKVLFLLYSFQFFCQNTCKNLVEYNLSFFNSDNNQKSFLIDCEDSSTFITDVGSTDIKSYNDFIDRPENLNLDFNFLVKYDKKEDYYIVGSNLWYSLKKSNTILAKDKNIAISWEIDNSKTKNLLGYKCNFAKGNFRGRKYYVWFTTEVPVSIFPYKFSGLPGVILEIIDENKLLHITASKIVLNSKIQVPKAYKSFLNDQEKKTLPYKDFIHFENKTLREWIMQSNANKNVGVFSANSNKINERELMLEKSFEWETEKEEPVIP